jgi:hypothetical protein
VLTTAWPRFASTSDGLKRARLAHELALRSNPRTRTGNLEYFYIFSGDFARAEEASEAWFRERPGNMSRVRHSRRNCTCCSETLGSRSNGWRGSQQTARRACSSPSRHAARPARSKPTSHSSVFVRRWIPRAPSATRTTPIQHRLHYAVLGDTERRRWRHWLETERRHWLSVLAVLPGIDSSISQALRAEPAIHTTRRWTSSRHTPAQNPEVVREALACAASLASPAPSRRPLTRTGLAKRRSPIDEESSCLGRAIFLSSCNGADPEGRGSAISRVAPAEGLSVVGGRVPVASPMVRDG